ncbi:AraC family transcriptional regulator [Vibrio fluvialis]|uniref:AraC family transcriptional regulator n=1 Tax=Vibrio fluvialis TaxID=676 RepID=UPI00192B6210|nr:helix-turn-helix transcriptional regulator [Vibrio fluvialis]ELL4666652.1 helix-turn-helix transcriptional regulator [Vibrio fluvialis]ELV8727857.1 helix-turn-helix transcriptional regulator [Vibrio fluvialis]EMA2445968.1 helix-turn-helix transcriptional regulator [Vibrio fluvialis]EMA8958670.1 helix-turn-helix transcriptional regulator [Vibrio fluvialis]MBL4306972.1 helix-turn-helix transcriptional regulator [Vibrio fluvialis]
MPNHIPETTMQTPSEVAFTLDASQPVLTHTRSMQAESGIVPHSHPRGQLLWAAKGILRVTSEHAVWVVPSTHAVWIPGGLLHQVSSETAAQTRNIYIDPSFAIRENEKAVIMLKMSPLMREIVLKLTESENHLSKERIQRLGLVALDELDALEPLQLFISSGDDPRLKKLISHIVNHAAQNEPLDLLSRRVGASVRTIERLFKAETGLTYRQWRSRFRLMNSLEHIVNGANTTTVAHQLGYQSVSSFISAFKSLFGCTPQEYASRKG